MTAKFARGRESAFVYVAGCSSKGKVAEQTQTKARQPEVDQVRHHHNFNINVFVGDIGLFFINMVCAPSVARDRS